MTKNNAVLRVLLDEEIRDIITDAHQAYGAFKTGYGLALGRAIESALLSKLRAEGVQAGDERDKLEADAFASTNGETAQLRHWWRKGYDTALQTRGTESETSNLAGQLWDDAIACDWPAFRAKVVAALASAPVAGEAQKPVAWLLETTPDGYALHRSFDFEEPPTGFPGLVRKTPLYAAPQASEAVRPALAVWYGSMPESNGKKNWTAILYRKGEVVFDGPHITIDRSEYPDRVRYEADRVRYLIGEITDEPFILDYDADKCDAAPQASEAVRNASLLDLLIRAQAWMATTRGENRPNNLIRLIDDALKTQADKDGGDCAPHNSDSRYADKSSTYDAVHVCHECDIAGCKHLRAALSAQPGAQKEQNDA